MYSLPLQKIRNTDNAKSTFTSTVHVWLIWNFFELIWLHKLAHHEQIRKSAEYFGTLAIEQGSIRSIGKGHHSLGARTEYIAPPYPPTPNHFNVNGKAAWSHLRIVCFMVHIKVLVKTAGEVT